MKHWCLIAVFTLIFPVANVSAQSDPGYIVKLYADCPVQNTTNFFTLKADVPAYATARCQNGNYTFSTDKGPISTLPVSLNSNQSIPGLCVLNKKLNINTYTVMVEVGWGEPSAELVMYQQQEFVACSYDPHGAVESISHNVQDFIIAPKEKQCLQGNHSQHAFILTLVNVMDRPIEGHGLGIGRTVRLKAVITGSALGFRALSCVAVNSAGTNYAILRGGCGDGAIFATTTGFITEADGKTVHSPWFSSFKLLGASDITFKCVFLECTTACPGSSCPNE